MDLSNLGFVALPAITVICYMFAEAVKTTTIDNKWLPIICMIAGAILGFLEPYINPATVSTDIFSSIAIGIVSGLAATGINEVIYQLKK